MHELSIMIEVVKQVEQVAKRENVEKVEKIVLEIGEVSGVVPEFLHECFPAAIYETTMEGTKLEIQTVKAKGKCKKCSKVYLLTKEKGVCPQCGHGDFEMLTGREFLIKEIVVWEE